VKFQVGNISSLKVETRIFASNSFLTVPIMEDGCLGLREGLQRFLGLEGEQLDGFVAQLEENDTFQRRNDLSSLLPDTPAVRRFIDAHCGRKKGAQGSKGAKNEEKYFKPPSPLSSGSSSKKKTLLTAEEKRLRESARRNRKIITGNEEGAAQMTVQNCLTCGMIYHSEKYRNLSRCEFCEDSLGKCQLKRVKEWQEEQDAALARAVAHRDKLLDFDVSSAAGTQVFDDQGDYFEMSADSLWVSDEERTVLQKKIEKERKEAEESSRKVHLSIDLAGRRVVEDRNLDGIANDVYSRLKKLSGT